MRPRRNELVPKSKWECLRPEAWDGILCTRAFARAQLRSRPFLSTSLCVLTPCKRRERAGVSSFHGYLATSSVWSPHADVFHPMALTRVNRCGVLKGTRPHQGQSVTCRSLTTAPSRCHRLFLTSSLSHTRDNVRTYT